MVHRITREINDYMKKVRGIEYGGALAEHDKCIFHRQVTRNLISYYLWKMAILNRSVDEHF